jgi:hypothetical protein
MLLEGAEGGCPYFPASRKTKGYHRERVTGQAHRYEWELLKATRRPGPLRSLVYLRLAQ